MKPLSLFDGYGIEIEYVICNEKDLSVSPSTDVLFKKMTGKWTNNVNLKEIILSNELVNHVIELKTNGPVAKLEGTNKIFLDKIQTVNELLKKESKLLLPTAMHPCFNPKLETVIWKHQNRKIYFYYDKLFNCKRHGWSNLQSTHLNLPFYDDKEFEILHSAIRLILPIIPVLAASSPIIQSKYTGFIDSRLDVYLKNQNKIPFITNKVIPEIVSSKLEYQQKILNKIYEKIKPYDDKNILHDEWLNSRGAIARFQRNTIEIRIIDNQETPVMDFAVLSFIVHLLKYIINKYENNIKIIKYVPKSVLYSVFIESVKKGSNAVITDRSYLNIFGINKEKCLVIELLNKIFEKLYNYFNEIKYYENELNVILNEGNLSERIIKNINNELSYDNIMNIYKKLCYCLNEGIIFQ